MNAKIEKEPEAGDKKTRLAMFEEELELIRQLHLRSIIKGGKSGEVSGELLKQIASYLKVIEELIHVSLLRADQACLSAPSVRLVWEVLSEIPEFRPLTSDRRIRAKVLNEIKKRLKEPE